MNANELRIGNRVRSDWGVSVVDAIGVPDSFGLREVTIFVERTRKRKRVCPTEIRPIAITKTWLAIFGAKKHPTSVGIKTIADTLNEALFLWPIAHEDGYYVKMASGKEYIYLHQLQNVFFLETGEELSIKEL